MSNNTNKIFYDLKNVHYAELKESEGGTVSYGDVKPWLGAVGLKLSAEGESLKFYADGIVYYEEIGNDGYKGDLETALIPEDFRTSFLNEIKDKNGVYIESGESKATKYFALLFEFEGDKNRIKHILYKTSVQKRPDIESKTKEDKKNINTESLSIETIPIEINGKSVVKARSSSELSPEILNAWYTKVYLPDAQE